MTIRLGHSAAMYSQRSVNLRQKYAKSTCHCFSRKECAASHKQNVRYEERAKRGVTKSIGMLVI